MSLTDIRRLERIAVCDTLRQVGPDASTLCSQWSAADVAGHLVASERYSGLPMVVAYRLRRVLPAGVTRRGMEVAAGRWRPTDPTGQSRRLAIAAQPFGGGTSSRLSTRIDRPAPADRGMDPPRRHSPG
jgi:hypothetical protein